MLQHEASTASPLLDLKLLYYFYYFLLIIPFFQYSLLCVSNHGRAQARVMWNAGIGKPKKKASAEGRLVLCIDQFCPHWHKASRFKMVKLQTFWRRLSINAATSGGKVHGDEWRKPDLAKLQAVAFLLHPQSPISRLPDSQVFICSACMLSDREQVVVVLCNWCQQG